ncbi:MAG: ArsC family transcriptional regulator [Clostridia bacterium]|nr:ArsC family transcriptional regulator [Clostridia bacterium]
MNVQIYGRSKCFDTKKAERYFKERGIPFQRVDIDRYGLGKRELDAVLAAVGSIDELIDPKSAVYKKENFAYISRDSAEKRAILEESPTLYRTPIVRNGRQATVGYQPDIWKNWQ